MPVLLELVVPFFIFAASIVIIGFAQAHASIQGTQDAPGFWDFITGKVLIKQLFGLATKAASFVASHFAAASLDLLAKWLVQMGTLTGGWFGVSALFAEATAAALERLERRGDPRARAEARKAAGSAAAAAGTAHHALRVGTANAHSLSTYKARVNPQLKTLHHATAVALPHDIAGLRERNKALERGQTKDAGAIRDIENGAIKTFDWIKSHPLSVATGVFTGAVAIALTRMGFGFLRCNSWKNLGKKLTCGVGAWLSALLDLVATFGLVGLSVLDPEALAEITVAAVDTVEPILAEILSR